jgi:two-component system LytT family response regulator
MSLKTVIVDDEPLARELIREYLTRYNEIQVIAECGDGRSAIETINNHRPDLIFLDVQMPGCDGFEVLEGLAEIPMVIFCTAYEQYALKAFEVSAVDYLLKPYDRERFDQAVGRVLDRRVESESMTSQVIALMQTLQKEYTYAKRLFVRLRGRVVPVDTTDVEWIEAQGDYAEIHTGKGSFLTSQNLSHLESLLDPVSFIRIHRSSIVNVHRIKELTRSESGSYTVTTTSGRQLPVGRTRVDRLKDWMV